MQKIVLLQKNLELGREFSVSKPGSEMPGAGPEYGTDMTLLLARNNSACVVCCHYFPLVKGKVGGCSAC